MSKDTRYTDEIVCPFCGCEFLESYEIKPGQEDVGEVDCIYCGQIMYVTRNVSISYSTEKAI